jgi:hypothetical protein
VTGSGRQATSGASRPKIGQRSWRLLTSPS